MDPEIQRALNDGVAPEKIAAELVRRNLPVPPELGRMMQQSDPNRPQEGEGNFGGAMVQGATMNLAGQASERFRQEQAEYARVHPVRSVAGQVLGGIGAAAGVAAVAPWALPAGALARFLYGAGTGGIAAGAEGGPDESLKDRAIRTGIGAGVGGAAALAVPPLARMAGHGVGKLLKPFVDKAGVIAENNAPLLPKNAVAEMARREAIAPGVAVPASLNPGLAGSLRAVGNNPRSSVQAEEAALGRHEVITQKVKELSGQIEDVVRPGGHEILGDVEGKTRSTMVKHAVSVDRNDQTKVSLVQRAREELRYDWKRAKGSLKDELAKDYAVMSHWLYKHSPDLEKLDKEYKLALRMKEEAEGVLKHLRQGMAGNARNKSSGLGSGSPGGSISKINTLMHAAMSPDQQKYGAETAKMLLTPGRVPKTLLNARASLARPAAPPQDFLWSGLLGRGTAPAAPTLAGLLDEE